ncbi:MAG: biosynthetic peptidoglycan transglycosylase [Bdellovibrionia bacterium]
MKPSNFKWTAAFAVWFFATVAIVAANLYYSIPSDETIKGCFIARMHQIEICPKSPRYVPISHINSFLKDAILVSEDTGFFHHNGFELEELKESLRVNLARGAFARGGSTISQQLARNLFLNSEKSILRKVKEAIITYRLEAVLSKNEILERYLNVVEFGKDIYGIGAAAQHYFKKAPSDLSLLESTYLAFLLPSPVKYSSSYYKGQLTKFTAKRIHQILFRMQSYQRISGEEYEMAKSMVKYFPWKDTDTSIVAGSLADQAAEEALSQGDEAEYTDEELGVDLTSPLGDEPEEI